MSDRTLEVWSLEYRVLWGWCCMCRRYHEMASLVISNDGLYDAGQKLHMGVRPQLDILRFPKELQSNNWCPLSTKHRFVTCGGCIDVLRTRKTVNLGTSELLRKVGVKYPPFICWPCHGAGEYQPSKYGNTLRCDGILDHQRMIVYGWAWDSTRCWVVDDSWGY